MKYLLLIMLLAGCLSISVAAQPHSEMEQADFHYTHFQVRRAIQDYNLILKEDPDNLKALCRSSIFYSRLGYRVDNKAHKEEYFKKAKKRAEHAIKIDLANSNANYAMGVALGRIAQISGIHKKVAAARTIRKYAKRALKADSTNDGAWDALGRWNYKIANLNFVQRMAFKTLFGGLPKGASTQKSIEYIKKAIALDPIYIMYYRDLADAYKALGKNQEAIKTCEIALKRPNLTPISIKYKKDCHNLIDDLK
jgi:tetratricopeptide (TPR) repeat protein